MVTWNAVLKQFWRSMCIELLISNLLKSVSTIWVLACHNLVPTFKVISKEEHHITVILEILGVNNTFIYLYLFQFFYGSVFNRHRQNMWHSTIDLHANVA